VTDLTLKTILNCLQFLTASDLDYSTQRTVVC
jgi:hypothetical protein